MGAVGREQAALLVDPWGEGKGDDPYRVLRNQMVTTRKPAECVLCFQPIRAGSRVRAQTEQSRDYGVKTFRFCPKCVEAMAAYSLEDNFKKLERRYTIGRRTAERRERQIGDSEGRGEDREQTKAGHEP
jgi:hypothetical protein